MYPSVNWGVIIGETEKKERGLLIWKSFAFPWKKETHCRNPQSCVTEVDFPVCPKEDPGDLVLHMSSLDQQHPRHMELVGAEEFQLHLRARNPNVRFHEALG